MRSSISPIAFARTFCFIAVLFSVTPTQAHAEEYRYDDFGRLIEVIFDSGQRIVYVYDNAGNRTEEKHIDPAPPAQ